MHTYEQACMRIIKPAQIAKNAVRFHPKNSSNIANRVELQNTKSNIFSCKISSCKLLCLNLANCYLANCCIFSSVGYGVRSHCSKDFSRLEECHLDLGPP